MNVRTLVGGALAPVRSVVAGLRMRASVLLKSALASIGMSDVGLAGIVLLLVGAMLIRSCS